MTVKITSVENGYAVLSREIFDWWDGKTYQMQPETRTTRGFSSFERPTVPIINPKQSDGYRQPSSWVAELKSLAILATMAGTHTYRNPSGWTYDTFTGTTVLATPLTELPTRASNVQSQQRNPLRMRILNNLREEILDVALVLAEMQGTVDLVTNGLYRVARSIDAVRARKPESFYYLMYGKRRDNRRPTDKFLRETAGTYLEWKYGVMPTVYDVAGACKALDINEEGSLFDNPPLLVARATYSDSYLAKSRFTGSAFGWSDVEVPLRIREQAAARIDYSVSAEGLRGLSRYGIGLSTLPTVLLERTPFMFVLNMAFPIMELVKAWTALSGGVTVRGYSETFYVSYQVLEGSAKPYGDDRLLFWSNGEPKSEFIRNAGASVPMPVPFVRNPIKTGNLATALALFTQLRKA